MKKYQTCKVYRYDGSMGVQDIEQKLRQHVGYIQGTKNRKIIKFEDFTHMENTLVFSIKTEKNIPLSNGSMGISTIEHAAAISQEHKMMCIFRPPLNEAFPKLFRKLLINSTDVTNNQLFDNVYFFRDRVIKYIESIKNDDRDAQIAYPRFKFTDDLYHSMTYFMFSARENECASVSQDYENALRKCTKFEPIIRFSKLCGLMDEKTSTKKLLQLNEDCKFWCVGNDVSIEDWLAFCYKHAKFFITPLTDLEREKLDRGEL